LDIKGLKKIKQNYRGSANEITPSSKPTSSNFLKNKDIVYNSASNNLNKMSENI